MSQPTITTRAGKGSPLTYTEVDSNFTNLQSATVGITDGTNSGTLNLNDQLTVTASGSASVVYNPTTKTLTVGGGSSLPSNAAGYLANDGAGNLSWATVSSGVPTGAFYLNAYTNGSKSSYGTITTIYNNTGITTSNSYSYNYNGAGTVSSIAMTFPAGSYYVTVPVKSDDSFTYYLRFIDTGINGVLQSTYNNTFSPSGSYDASTDYTTFSIGSLRYAMSFTFTFTTSSSKTVVFQAGAPGSGYYQNFLEITKYA